MLWTNPIGASPLPIWSPIGHDDSDDRLGRVLEHMLGRRAKTGSTIEISKLRTQDDQVSLDIGGVFHDLLGGRR